MTDASSKKSLSDVLSNEEQVTLRRVAFGESPAHTLRAADLDQLRSLRLIEDSKDGPVLTTKGRHHYATLPRALGAGPNVPQESLIDTLTKALRGTDR
jgi:hypothetical protein